MLHSIHWIELSFFLSYHNITLFTMLSSLETSSSLQHHYGPTRMTASNYIRYTQSPAVPSSVTAKKANSTLILDDESMTLAHSTLYPNGELVPNEIHIGGRKSKLAVAQSLLVKSMIKEHYPTVSCPILALTTLGDQVQNKPLYSFGGKSLWTKELEILLLESLGEYHKLDLIVHSLKDMPTNLPEEFELGCITKREDPSDALVMAKNSPYQTLADLPAGSVVGTSSVRRSAQLKRHYPQLRFESIRGNLQTRLSKLDDPNTDFKCIILATAGLVRMGLADRITERLDSSIMMHAVGQGALGIEIRSGDKILRSILEKIQDINATLCCTAERALMKTLEGGCSVPIGCKTNFDEETKELTLKGLVISVDGTKFVEGELTTVINLDQEDFKAQAEQLGADLAKNLIEKGAKVILDEINLDKVDE